jgi:hypothetical protein
MVTSIPYISYITLITFSSQQFTFNDHDRFSFYPIDLTLFPDDVEARTYYLGDLSWKSDRPI